MTVSVASVAWFLDDSEDTKMYRAICNYLSLGQFELARPLIRMHHESESVNGSPKSAATVIRLMIDLIESGTPDSWICTSKSVRSTSHLHSMCIDLIVELVGDTSGLPEWYRLRCAFELRLSLALIESDIVHSLHVGNELRRRFALYLCDKFSLDSSAIILPRLLIMNDSAKLLVIESTQLDSLDLNSTPLNLDCTEWIFDICRGAPHCGPGLLEILHSVSPLISVQLTHLQAALVCDSLLAKSSRRSNVKRWKRACRNLRFLNELNTVITDMQSVSDPLLVDLISLLVCISNSENGFEIFTIDFSSNIDRLIADCLSPNHGAFPFIMSKKRRPLFSLSTIGSDERIVCNPNDSLRQAVFESLCTVTHLVSKSVVKFFGELEDDFQRILSSKLAIPPCFSSEPFWDRYYEFIRVSGNHCLAFPASTAIELIRSKDIKSVISLLSHFNQLKPLIVLLCWELSSDVDSRSDLIETFWTTYCEGNQKCNFTLFEDSVVDLAYQFGLAKLAVSSKNCLDVLSRLRSNSSFFRVIRKDLKGMDNGSKLMSCLSHIPQPSTRLTSQFAHDMDFARAYFALREAIGLVMNSTKSDSVDLGGLDELCRSISDDEIRESVLDAIVTLVLSEPCEMHVFISLIFLVCQQGHRSSRKRGEILLLKYLLALKQSVIVLGINSGPIGEVSGWVTRLVLGTDTKLAKLCDDLPLPRVGFDAETVGHVTPPSASMRIDKASEFIPRLREMNLIQIALEVNDFELAEKLVGFLGLDESAGKIVADAKQFANVKKTMNEKMTSDDSMHLPDKVTRLIDLAISAKSEVVSLKFLRHAHELLLSAGEQHAWMMQLAGWANKLLVLLEAKTEFNSTTEENSGGVVRLSELILGIETLPNEPELLKDHLTRMHSQRSAIMSLVDRVDKFRKNTETEDRSPEHTTLDFLSDAIRTLEGGGLETSVVEQSSILIKFLEYLNKVCFLIQEAATVSSVSFFSVLSEQPVDIVAKLIFVHKGIPQAIALAEMMGLDIVQVVLDHSVSVVSTGHEPVAGKYFISIDILHALSDSGKLDRLRIIQIALEQRSERWPNGSILDFVNDTKRKNAWDKFVRSYSVLMDGAGGDVAEGFTIEEQSSLDKEMQTALRAVYKDSIESMDALCRMSARALMLRGEYIPALCELDSNLKTTDEKLVNDALMGCLTDCSDSLSPQSIYELLWRVPDVEKLVELVKQFYRNWEAKIALKALELCVERSLDDPETESELLFEIRQIRVMDKVSSFVPSHGGWQSLQDLSDVENCIIVIRDLLEVFQHNLADEFLALKSKILAEKVDALSDEIELSRLGSMWKQHDRFLERLQMFHHPLKASRLAIALISSFSNIESRIALGQLVLANGIACEEDEGVLETQLASLALFLLTDSPTLRPEWNPLLDRPDLVFESLLMNGVTNGIGEWLSQFKSWRNDSLLLRLARKAMRLDPPTSVLKNAIFCCDIGLGGVWSLTGLDDKRDFEIRSSHAFSGDKPDMMLALNLLNLCSGDSKMNATSIFDLANDLSLYLHNFVKLLNGAGLGCGSSSSLSVSAPLAPSPFIRLSFLRQAIICLIDLLARKFSKSFKPHITEHAFANLELIIDVWVRVGVRIGLKAISNPTIQIQLRDLLIQADALDLAKRVCFALGPDRPGALDSADIVNMERVKLAIRIGDLESAKKFTREFNAKKLSIPQLEEIENALIQSRDYIPICEFKNQIRLAAIDEMERRSGRCEKIERFCVLSQVIDDETVCIQTPIALPKIDQFENDRDNSRIQEELLFFCANHGEIGSGVYFLLKSGNVEEAVWVATDSALVPKVFISLVARAVGIDSQIWHKLLFILLERNLKTYLSSAESFLRFECAYDKLYPYEVAMGREAHAAIVCIHLYLRVVSWEQRMGFLESCRIHLEVCWSRRKFSKRLKGGEKMRQGDLSEDNSDSDYFQPQVVEVTRITIPFSLPMSEGVEDGAISDLVIQSLQTLVSLQLEVCTLMPVCAQSASLFGSIQSVSELIDYLLMDGHVALAKRIIGKVKLPDSALCGIFDDI